MGRPEPHVIYSHTFNHPQLDEYVDEVLFAEPVVVSSCEIVEQNAPSACSSLKIVGMHHGVVLHKGVFNLSLGV